MTTTEINTGGPAYPMGYHPEGNSADQCGGLTIRDWFAGTLQADDRLVKAIRAMDDTALLLFAVHPDLERDEWTTETGILCGSNIFVGKTEVEKVVLRLTLEARAIARVRYMQADAMLAARELVTGTA